MIQGRSTERSLWIRITRGSRKTGPRTPTDSFRRKGSHLFSGSPSSPRTVKAFGRTPKGQGHRDPPVYGHGCGSDLVPERRFPSPLGPSSQPLDLNFCRTPGGPLTWTLLKLLKIFGKLIEVTRGPNSVRWGWGSGTVQEVRLGPKLGSG